MTEITIRDMGVADAIIMENEVQALQSQLGQAHEALLLAQADAETLRERINHYTQADELEERLRGWDALCVLAREAHPGTALVERLAQADAREAGLQLAADQYSESRDQWMLKAKAAQAEIARLISTHDRQMAESEHRGADARNDRNIMRQALGEIDRHVETGGCAACADMREIAAHALRIVKGGKT